MVKYRENDSLIRMVKRVQEKVAGLEAMIELQVTRINIIFGRLRDLEDQINSIPEEPRDYGWEME